MAFFSSPHATNRRSQTPKMIRSTIAKTRGRLQQLPIPHTRAKPGKLSIVVSYRGIPHARGWETGAALAKAFRRLGHHVFDYGNYYQTPERLQWGRPERKPDLLVYMDCADEDPPYFELKDLQPKAAVYWDFDVDNGRQEFTAELTRQLKFDYIFHANKHYHDHFANLARKRPVFLPYAYDDEHFFPDPNLPKTHDLALVGSPYKQRQDYADRLKRLGVELEFINGVYREDLRKTINAIKIHLNLNIFGPGGDGLLVGRVWETIGCGSMLMNQRKDFIEDFFEDGKHLILFADERDCAEKAQYYLKHDAERELIARAGHEHGQTNHTYIARAKTILATVKPLL